MSMDIYAKRGTKVQYIDKNGYENDLEHARKFLNKDQWYTVDKTVAGDFSTTVYFKEFENIGFNSVHFMDAEELMYIENLDTNSGMVNLGDTSSNTLNIMNDWGAPIRVGVWEYEDKIEMVYKQTSNLCYTSHPSPPPEEQIFKIIFSCVDGKWNKSERIFGKIIRATNETYDFEN